MLDMTMTFSFESDREGDIKKIITTVYDALKEKDTIPLTKSWAIFFRKIQHILRLTTMPAV